MHEVARYFVSSIKPNSAFVRTLGNSFPGCLSFVGDDNSERATLIVQVDAYEQIGLPSAERGGPRGQHISDQLDERSIAALKSGARLVLDFSAEGVIFSPEYLENFNVWANDFGIAMDRIALLTQNRAFEKEYVISAASNGMAVFAWDAYIIDLVQNAIDRQIGLLSKEDHCDIRHPFLCLNYAPRIHRVALMLALLDERALDRSLVSFSGLSNEKVSFSDAQLAAIKYYDDPQSSLMSRLNELREIGSLTIDDFSQGGNYLALNFSPDMHRHVHTVIVSETDFYQGSALRVTEKTFKPIIFEKPFLILGNPHSLALLKDFGFETFSEIYNESYDEANSVTERFGLLRNEIRKVSRMTPEQLTSSYESVREICRYNRMFLEKGFRQGYFYRHAAPIINWMSS